MKTERRWMKSVIAAAAECQTVMPFQRGAKRRPAAFSAAPAKITAAPRPKLAAR